MKPLEYISISGELSFPSVEIADVAGFIRLIQLYDVEAVFKQLLTDKTEVEWFLFIHDRIVYKLKANGFQSVDDYNESLRAGFPEAAAFYDARNFNIRSFREYETIKKAGTTDKVLYSRAQKLGFVDGYERFRQRLEKETNIPSNFDNDKINSPLRLYEYAIELGFKDYGDFVNAFFAGFGSANEWVDARARNFSNAKEYHEATKMGLTRYDEYTEAKEKGISSKAEFEKYAFLKQQSHNKYSFDQVLLINALKRYENGRKLSINKMKDVIRQQELEYFGKDEAGNILLPSWYTTRLKKDEDFQALLLDNSDLRDHGLFDVEGEFYQVSRILNNKILIDGANVAFASKGKRNEFSKAKYANILSIVKELKNMRFKDIVVISDASLRHRTIDKNVLDVLKNEKITYLEAPAATQADEFLLEMAKKAKCYIVSNDQFRDYRDKDEWVEDNIDRLRIPFMIVNGEATLSIRD